MIKTPLGEISCKLFPEKAPKTVASFVGLARGKKAWRDPLSGEVKTEPFFDGLAFHRVIPEYMIQGGDPRGTGSGGPGYKFKDETRKDLKHSKPGVFSMANSKPATVLVWYGPTCK